LAEDLGLWLRLSSIGNIVSSPEPLLKYRVSQSSTIGQHQHKALVVRDLTRRDFDFDRYAKEALVNLRETHDNYLLLDHSDERFILHLIEIVELYVSRKSFIGLVNFMVHVFPLLRVSFLPTLFTILKIRKRKNKIKASSTASLNSVGSIFLG
jgi:hypothetical protein